MRRIVLGALLALASCLPAHAHRLKVFAAMDAGSIGGYAFFVGGGRAQNSSWTAKDEQGSLIASGTTDEQGRFTFPLPRTVTSDVTVTVDTHEAHVASATLSANRLAGAVTVPADAPATDTAASTRGDQRIAALVEAAVQHQIEPLLERIEQMDSRLRFVDILSGIFLIAGAAGTALWARARRN